ncbi:MAG TPA: ABC transporter substrate-binding protein, partial [Alicycliphilus sp.]|nr:ABC transporter substrate-binding protein [Alicycliphilus sp.]
MRFWRICCLWGGCMWAAPAAWAAHAYAMWGDPALPAGFTHLPYVNPDAPKGGELRLVSNLRASP